MTTAADFTVAPLEKLEPWAEEMLAEQEEVKPAESAEPQQQDPAANDVLLFQVPSLAVGDAQGLADLLMAHPELYEQILSTAASFLGNDTVAKALEIVSGKPAEEQQAAPPQAEEVTPTEVIEQQASEETNAGKDEVTTEQAQQENQAETESAQPEPEAGWVVRARAYNANHADEVQLFNHATGYSCLGANGEIDPNAVANWQAANGVSPDGRVGKETADAAWSLMPVEQPSSPAQLPEEPVEV